MISPEMKNAIDEMSYYGLLERWRNSPCGDPMFQGEAGEYYAEVMHRKREEVGGAAHVAASKSIGWEG